MPDSRVSAAQEALDAGRRAEHADDLQRALHHYADAAIRAGGDPAVVTRALTGQAAVYRRLSEWELAADYARRARELAEDADLPVLRAEALVAEGNALMCSGRFDEAVIVYDRLSRVATDDRQRGIAMQNLGSIHAQRGDHGAAADAFERSRTLFEDAGYARGVAIATHNLGRLAHDTGDLERAEPLLRAALTAAREVEDAELCALALLNLAQLHVARRKLSDAGPMVTEAFGHFVVSENRWRQVECLCVMADIAEGQGDAEDVRAHLERGARIAREIGARVELRRIEGRLNGN
jgi:tetratricopeptide (TPR) repeat protein